MANIGKYITAAGGVIIAVFSLVGLIVILASKSVGSSEYEMMGPLAGMVITTGVKVNAAFQGLVMILLGAGLVVGSLLAFEKCSKCLCGLAGVIILLASSLVPSAMAVGGMNFYIILGGLVALAGCHAAGCSCMTVCKPTPAEPVPGPESKL